MGTFKWSCTKYSERIVLIGYEPIAQTDALMYDRQFSTATHLHSVSDH